MKILGKKGKYYQVYDKILFYECKYVCADPFHVPFDSSKRGPLFNLPTVQYARYVMSFKMRWNSRTNSWVEVSGHNLESS